MKSKEYNKSLILSQAEELKESIYIIFSPIFSAYLSYSGRHIKLLPFQGVRGIAGMREGEWRLIC